MAGDFDPALLLDLEVKELPEDRDVGQRLFSQMVVTIKQLQDWVKHLGTSFRNSQAEATALRADLATANAAVTAANATIDARNATITTVTAERDAFRRNVPGYHVEGYVPDPQVHQVEFPDIINNIGFRLPSVPMKLRIRGPEGVMMASLHDITFKGPHNIYKHCAIVPSDFPITITCGATTASDEFIRRHIGCHDGCGDLQPCPPKFKARAGTTPSWELVNFSEGHMNWSNEYWKRKAGTLPGITATAPMINPRAASITGSSTRIPFDEVEMATCNSGNRIKTLPTDMLSMGIEGVYLARVIGAENQKFEWTLFVPPGFPILRWCGLLYACGNPHYSHRSCAPCKFGETDFSLPISELQGTRLQYEFKRFTNARHDWNNLAVTRQFQRRRRINNERYTLPDPPLPFENFSDNDKQYEARMLTQADHGDVYDRTYNASATGTLHEKPTIALYMQKLRYNCYLWTHNRPANVPNNVRGPFMTTYPTGWATMNFTARKNWIIGQIGTPDFNENGISPPAHRPALPAGLNFPGELAAGDPAGTGYINDTPAPGHNNR